MFYSNISLSRSFQKRVEFSTLPLGLAMCYIFFGVCYNSHKRLKHITSFVLEKEAHRTYLHIDFFPFILISKLITAV